MASRPQVGLVELNAMSNNIYGIHWHDLSYEARIIVMGLVQQADLALATWAMVEALERGNARR